jgi:hypothetical protein
LHNPVEPSVDVLKATGGRIYVGGEVRNRACIRSRALPPRFRPSSRPTASSTARGLTTSSSCAATRTASPTSSRPTCASRSPSGHTDNDIFLRPFDTVYVPKKTISKMDLFVSQYIDQLVPFDNSLGVSGQYYLNEQEVDSRSRNLNFGTGTSSILGLVGP